MAGLSGNGGIDSNQVSEDIRFPFSTEEEELESGKLTRTPSGNILTNSVEEKIAIFSKKKEGCLNDNCERDEDTDTENSQGKGTCLKLSVTNNQKTVSQQLRKKARKLALEGRSASLKRKTNSEGGDNNTNQLIKRKQIAVSDIKDPSEEELNQLAQILQSKESETSQMSKQGDNAQDSAINSAEEVKDNEMEVNHSLEMETSNQGEANTSDNPQVVALAAVQLMFQELKNEMAEMKTEMKTAIKKVEDGNFNRSEKGSLKRASRRLCRR